MTRPPALREGDVVALVSPSSAIAAGVPRRVRRGMEELERRGLRVRLQPHALDAGEHDAELLRRRVADLEGAFADPDVAAVVCTIGGWGSNALLDALDYDVIGANPKPFVGYSDATALHMAIWTQTGLSTIYGPALLPQFGEYGGTDDYTWRSFERTVMRVEPPGEIEPSPEWTVEQLRWDVEDDRPRRLEAAPPPRVLRAGSAEGPLVAAHLGTLLALAGTRFWPDLTGAILAIELDEAAGAGHLDRSLVHLGQTGALDRISALALGRTPPTGVLDGEEAERILLRATAHRGLPVAVGLPFGHVDPIASLPIGVPARADFGDEARLLVLEPAVTHVLLNTH